MASSGVHSKNCQAFLRLGPDLVQLFFNHIVLAKASHTASLSKEGPLTGRNSGRPDSLGATNVTFYHGDDVSILIVKIKSFFFLNSYSVLSVEDVVYD